MTNSISPYREARKWAHLTSGTYVLRAAGESAWVHKIVINTSAAGILTIYNNGAASGEIFYLTNLTAGAGYKKTLSFDVGLNNGLTITLSVPMDITVIYE